MHPPTPQTWPFLFLCPPSVLILPENSAFTLSVPHPSTHDGHGNGEEADPAFWACLDICAPTPVALLLWEETICRAHMVKNLPAVLETWVLSLHWEYPLEKGMATHSSILAWRITWTEEPGGLQSMGCKESDTTERLTLSLIQKAREKSSLEH